MTNIARVAVTPLIQSFTSAQKKRAPDRETGAAMLTGDKMFEGDQNWFG